MLNISGPFQPAATMRVRSEFFSLVGASSSTCHFPCPAWEVGGPSCSDSGSTGLRASAFWIGSVGESGGGSGISPWRSPEGEWIDSHSDRKRSSSDSAVSRLARVSNASTNASTLSQRGTRRPAKILATVWWDIESLANSDRVITLLITRVLGNPASRYRSCRAFSRLR